MPIDNRVPHAKDLTMVDQLPVGVLGGIAITILSFLVSFAPTAMTK